MAFIPSGSDRNRWQRLAVWVLLLAPAISLHAERPLAHSGQRSREDELDLYHRGRWEFSFETAWTFHVVSNPWATLVQREISTPNPLNYNLATQLIGFRYRLTNPNGPSILRGSFESSATLVATAIVSGPESYFAGFALGLRYDFVQPGARLVPYFEVRGGPGVTDSRGVRYTQQQDLTFTYIINAGLRYDLSPRWSISVSAVDQHLSNAYLAEENYGFDSLGVSLGVFSRF